MKKRLTAVLAAPVIMALASAAVADSDSAKIAALQHQIEALQARIEHLEARHTFASFMPDVAERFHVMHRAGEAGDWAVASHELAEIKRITGLATAADVKNGKLMQSMMAPSYDALDDAIEHGNHEKFDHALEQTIASCNACHVATGSDFVQVTLDAREAISLRHPHRLDQRGAPVGHTHGMAEGMKKEMEKMMPESAEPHGHAEGTPAHQD
ncbi:MAG: hypothetical protein OEN20_00890 [Gammaproteobacteria bacterium]|nr:hypothetical protein [Gammaproteobacteria bacterium]